MTWVALCLPTPCPPSLPDAAQSREALHGLAIWALQFSPRVALRGDAVLVELGGSERLFGGRKALRARIGIEGAALGVVAVAWGRSGLGALALARAGADGFATLDDVDAAADLLDSLPLPTLDAALPHLPTLARLGCQRLGELRRLPRGGVARRFGAALLEALDQAYGLRPEPQVWFTLPERFEATLELQAPVDNAAALLFGARRLLLQLGGWLAARQAGVVAFTLAWWSDTLRHQAGRGSLMVRTAEPSRDADHLARLLGEQLARARLDAPAEALLLRADEVRAWAPPSASLLPDPVQQRAALGLALERVAARLGASHVLRPVLRDDARPEASQTWQEANMAAPRQWPVGDGLPQPTFLLPRPLRLAQRGDQPLYQGALQLLLGPHRIEGGWWDRDGEATRHVARDYWVARSEHAGILWVFHTRLAADASAWFLHGMFA